MQTKSENFEIQPKNRNVSRDPETPKMRDKSAARTHNLVYTKKQRQVATFWNFGGELRTLTSFE